MTLIILGIGLIAPVYAVHLYFPINKHLVTASYILLSFQLSCFLLLCFIWKERINTSFKPLVLLGKNPLVLYIISGLEYLIIQAVFPPSLNLYAAVLVSSLALLLCLAVAVFLDRKKIYLKV